MSEQRSRARKTVVLCEKTCDKYHTKEFVAEQLGVSLRTLYNYVADGLKVTSKGTIHCPNIRAYYSQDCKEFQKTA